MPAETRLPPEIWCIVITDGGLRTRDANALCLVSKHLLQSCRPVLYRHVRLGDWLLYAAETIELLKNDTTLSNKVQELELMTHRPYWKHNSLGFDVETFTSLKRLRKIVFNGWPFQSAADQDRFSAIVSEQCLLLEALTCHNISTRYVGSLSKRLSIPRLKTISWSQAGFSGEFILLAMDLVRRSFSTIVELTLPSTTRLVPSLWSLTLAKLRSLSLGPWHAPVGPGDDLAYFLSRHPTLESFSLIFYPEMDSSIVLHDPVPPSACPNLKHITANILILTELLNTRVEFLETLESLSTGRGVSRDLDLEYIVFNNALVRYGKLRAVKSLSIIAWGIRYQFEHHFFGEDVKIKEWMAIYAESFPNLERWTGFVPRGNRVQLFSPFRKLKEIEHNWIPIRTGVSARKYVRGLASELAFLERVILSVETYTDESNLKLVFEVDELDEEADLDEISERSYTQTPRILEIEDLSFTEIDSEGSM